MVMDNVLIVGAGPTGLVLAIELLRRKVPVRLIDKRRGPSHTTRAMSIHARSMEMFHNMGVAHRLEEVSFPGPGNLYHFPWLTSDTCPRTDFRKLPTRFNHYYKICQNDFEQVLRAHIRATYSVEPEYGTEFISASQTNDAAKAVLLLVCGCETEHICSYIVGADGAHSKVRDAAYIPFPGRVVGTMGMIDVPATSVITRPSTPSPSWMNYYFNRSCFVCYTLMPNNLWRFYLCDKTGALAGNAVDPRRAFQSALDDLHVPVALDGQPSWHSTWTILNNVADQYRRARILICGDASHVHSPAGGQGMNGSMQDAFNLGWKLAAVWHGEALDTILDTYERERRPIGEQISEGARATHEIIMGFDLTMEDRFAITQQPDWERRTTEMVSALSHNYRTVLPGNLSRESLSGPRPGDRVPDCNLRLDPTIRLYDLLRTPSFVVLLVGEEEYAAEIDHKMRVAEVRADIVFIGCTKAGKFSMDCRCPDENKELRDGFAIQPGEDRIIVVRPDLFIGATCRFSEWELVLDYMKQWFM